MIGESCLIRAKYTLYIQTEYLGFYDKTDWWKYTDHISSAQVYRIATVGGSEEVMMMMVVGSEGRQW